MTASQMSLYNGALTIHIGERKLASLTENREPRRALDDVYASTIDEALESGYWKVARRTVQLTASTTVVPEFGYQYAFDVPSDLLMLYLLRTSPDGPPLNDYALEAGFIRARVDTLYLTYISNNNGFGTNFAMWSPAFARYVQALLASKVCLRLTQSETKTDRCEKQAQKYKRLAASVDARNGPTETLPQGTWVRARLASPFGMGENGNGGV